MPELTFGAAAFAFEPYPELLETVRTAEKLGFAQVWGGDSQMLMREAYVTLGAFGAITNRVKIGCSVSHPQLRHVTVLASAWSSLAELTGGRAVIGLGLGDSAVETLGMKPARMAVLSECIRVMRKLIAGESVELDGHEVKLNHAYGSVPPLYVAASGPRMIELTGREADGAILLVGTDPELLKVAVEGLERGAVSSGRSLADLDIVVWAPFSIDRDGDLARSRVRTHVARAIKHPQPIAFSAEDEKVIERIRQNYDYYQHLSQGAPQEDEVPRRLVDRFAISGTPEEVLERVNAIARSGLPIGQIALVPHGPDKAAQLTLFASEVMSRLS